MSGKIKEEIDIVMATITRYSDLPITLLDTIIDNMKVSEFRYSKNKLDKFVKIANVISRVSVMSSVQCIDIIDIVLTAPDEYTFSDDILDRLNEYCQKGRNISLDTLKEAIKIDTVLFEYILNNDIPSKLDEVLVELLK
jgi:hypothetical protein